jgi:hypothetical protein
MTREQFEHVLRASGSVSGCRDLIVIGSQAILASHPSAPEALLRSMEVDLYPRDAPGLADLIDGSIGELSPFHEAFGYYAHAVGPETAVLPANWRDRLVRLENANTGGIVGWCLSPVDIAASKLLAGREKDAEYVGEMLRFGLVRAEAVRGLAGELEPAAAGRMLEALTRAQREKS